ncbi:MAG: GNAT family N-acetyltransferase [Woeseiaceae bacterium]
MLTLESERLRLRPFDVNDATFLLELLNEPGWKAFIRDHDIETADAAGAYIEKSYLSTYPTGKGFLVVEHKETHLPMGICGLIDRDYLDTTDLGFAFLERHWGKGFAGEAALAVVDDARQRLKLASLLAITMAENTRSIALLLRLGFCFDGPVQDPATGESLRAYRLVLQ